MQVGEDKCTYRNGLSINGAIATYLNYNGAYSTEVDGVIMGANSGGLVALPGKDVSVYSRFVVSPAGFTENNFYALDTLVLFDPDGFEQQIGQPEYKGGSIEKYGTFAYYYAAKPEGTYDIDRMNTLKIEDLEYYESVEQLHAAGKTCCGYLIEFRATKFIRIGASYNIDFSTKLKVKEDNSIVGNVYPVVIKNTAWWKSDTDKYAVSLGKTIVNNENETTGQYIPSIYEDPDGFVAAIRKMEDGVVKEKYASYDSYMYSAYTPAKYENGVYVSGHLPKLYTGDSLYIFPCISETRNLVEIRETTGYTKKNFDLDNGQNIVDFKLTPFVKTLVPYADEQHTTVTMTYTLPEDLVYNNDAVIGGIYTASSPWGYHGTMSSDETHPMTDLNTGGAFGDINCKRVQVTKDDDGNTVLTFVFENVPYGKELSTMFGEIRFSAT
ncbi:MAG: hypothetical protein HUJ58_01270, partial [Erysipelotrichaceae bacterium]|nr:hypothetical protein [Erysipelotrichaceae bacterium]